jgi:predicted dehydrogenase
VSYGPALRAELEYWLACLETNTPPSIVTPEDGVEAVALAERVMAAAKKTQA